MDTGELQQGDRFAPLVGQSTPIDPHSLLLKQLLVESVETNDKLDEMLEIFKAISEGVKEALNNPMLSMLTGAAK